MHGSNRLGGNSLSDLLVFGRRAGWHAAEYAQGLTYERPPVDDAQVDAAAAEALRPFSAETATAETAETGGAEEAAAAGAGAGVVPGAPPENPYTLHQELQQAMNDLVGIIRREGEMEQALKKLGELRVRGRRAGVEGHRQFNPGWHLALDLRNMLLVSECVARAALERTESRGGHTREDYPSMDRAWRRINLLCRLTDPTGGLAATDPVRGQITLSRETTEPIRADLLALFEKEELVKYLAEEELYE
jgi:succinate dehydrogenase / fumarate reductase flavoprotein subunit